MAQDIHVKGLADLNKFLQELPVKIEKNILRGALRAGMRVVLPQAQLNVPADTGDLRSSLRIGTRFRRGVATAYLKTSEFYARFVEFGTKAHFISVQESEKPINRRLSFRRGEIVRASMTTVNRNVLRIGTKFVGPTVHHPGAKPHPFLRPALDQQATAAVNAAAEYMRNRLATKHGIDTSHIVLEGDE